MPTPPIISTAQQLDNTRSISGANKFRLAIAIAKQLFPNRASITIPDYREAPAASARLDANRFAGHPDLITALHSINQDPQVLYPAEFAKHTDYLQKNKQLTEQVNQLGFSRPSAEKYHYQGANPAAALRGLLAVKPIVLDCGTSLHLLRYKALLEKHGDAVFNAYIETACEGKLLIDQLHAPPIKQNIDVYFQASTGTAEQPLDGLKTPPKLGDQVWIMGPPEAYLFHPSSDSNAYNLLVQPGNPARLVGFVSQASATHGTWTYTQMRDLLLQKYNQPLTLGDLQFLCAHSSEQATHSNFNYGDALRHLQTSQPSAFAEAITQLTRHPVDLASSTSLLPPAATHIRGVMVHIQDAADYFNPAYFNSDYLNSTHFKNGLAADSDPACTPFRTDKTYTTHLPIKSEQAFKPEQAINPEQPIECWIPDYETGQPYQRDILTAVSRFRDRCLENDKALAPSQQFFGSIIYGDPGTGKTMACQAAAQDLTTLGLTVWQTDFAQGNTLLTLEEQQALLLILQSEGRAACDQAIVQKMAPAWDQADVLYIDDTNNPHDVLAEVSNAALQYARANGKKILINSNQDPIQAFLRSIRYPVDNVELTQVRGTDYRHQHAWYQQIPRQDHLPCSLQIASLQTPALQIPSRIGRHETTVNQQNIYQQLHQLTQHSGQNGVAFYGHPGMGKTTAIKQFFAERPELKTRWLEPHSMQQFSDHLTPVKALLEDSEAEFLVIDDCNDPKGNIAYQRLLHTLLNHEYLNNREGKPLRIVLISNRGAWEDLITDCIGTQAALTPRMQSRYLGRFMTVPLSQDQDYRAFAEKRGQISLQEPADLPKDTYRLVLAEYLQTYQEMTNNFSYWHAQTVSFQNGGYEELNNPQARSQRDRIDKERTAFTRETLQKIATHQPQIIDLRNCDLSQEKKYWTTPLLQQVLDTMEDHEHARVIILSNDPKQTHAQLTTLLRGSDGSDKYLSRLQRLTIAT